MHWFEFQWNTETKNLEIRLQATSKHNAVYLTKENTKMLHQKIRNAVDEYITSNFCSEYKVMGRVTEVVSRDSRNNKFTKDGGLLSYSSHSFIHQARLDISRLKCSVTTATQSVDHTCRKCGGPFETLKHVLNSCVPNLTMMSERHDAVLQRVAQGIREGEKKHLRLTIDRKCDHGSNRQRPDIMLFDDEKKTLIISDITCPYENGEAAMKTAHDRKIEKYLGIQKEYQSRGYSVEQLPIVVGSLGNWRPENDKATKSMGIPRAYNNELVKVITATVIEHSKNIYWKHLYGDKYKIVPKFVPCVTLKGARWKRITTMNLMDPEPLFDSNDQMDT